MKPFKYILLFAVISSFSSQIFAQTKKTKPGVSLGVLGAVNLTQFRVTNPQNIDYKTGTGWAKGFWLNVPITEKLSIEPQGQWSVLKYVGNNNPTNQFAGTIQYGSFPLLFKYAVDKDVAVILGPQFDFTNDVTNSGANAATAYTKSNFIGFSKAVVAGVELFPRRRVQVYGRYMHGLSDMKSSTNPNINRRNIGFYNSGFQFGLKVKLYEKKVASPAPPPPPPPPAPVVVVPKDTDGDGIIDDNDKCPTVKGLAKYQGCPIPDTDKDAINDEQDKCPTVAGTAKYQGCPVPDTDKDGINDEQDKCPTVPGLARYNGCPIPDTDGDGVNDEEDKCPSVKGLADNNGCPELKKQYNFDYRKVLFVTGSAVLTKGSKVELAKIIKALNEYPSLKLYVDGYTDNKGSDKINIPLSLKRASSVKAFLFSKKIDADRLLTEGHGSENPVADNKTAKGRAENRRVEFRLREVN